MKRFILGIGAIAAVMVTPALAADLGLKAPTPAAATWTGCYIDGGVGYGLWNQGAYAETSPPLSASLVPVTGTSTDGGHGWLGRLGGGCDYQLGDSIVVGAFGDYDWMSLKGTSTLDLTSTTTPFFGIAGDQSERSAWSVGARIGYLVTPRLLTYFDGGYTRTTFGQVNYNTNDNGTAPIGTATGLSLPATTYSGWFLGGGTEYALNMAWIPLQGLYWRNEYRLATYSSQDIGLVCAGGGAPCGAARPEGVSEHVGSNYVQTITTGLVWKFNFGRP